MKVRKRQLPRGWYPDTAEEVKRKLDKWETELGPAEDGALAGIVPHAGWEFSGILAYDVIRRVRKNSNTIVVIGGHLGHSASILAAFEDAYETPAGVLKSDLSLLNEISSTIDISEDVHADNTVEIQFPMVEALFPEADALYLRAPAGKKSITLGSVIVEAAEKLGKTVSVIGSTDLTHYGPAYSFSPHGSGSSAYEWVKNKNDAEILHHFIRMDENAAVQKANADHAACSVGAAAAAMGFAKKSGVSRGRLINYSNSYEISPASSFVGYGGVAYYSGSK